MSRELCMDGECMKGCLFARFNEFEWLALVIWV